MQPDLFILVNNSILDYSKYVKQIMLLKAHLKHKVADWALTREFEVIKNQNPSYHETHLILFNKEKDLLIELKISKQSPEEFT